eukprot:gene6386-biopygen5285
MRMSNNLRNDLRELSSSFAAFTHYARVARKTALQSYFTDDVIIVHESSTTSADRLTLTVLAKLQYQSVVDEGQKPVEIEAYIVPTIANIRNLHLEEENETYKHLCGLKFSDFYRTEEQLTFDILIGSDYLWYFPRRRHKTEGVPSTGSRENQTWMGLFRTIGGLKSQLVKLKRTPDILAEYDKIIKEHLKTGVIGEVVELESGEKVHYLPHQVVVREDAETTKLKRNSGELEVGSVSAEEINSAEKCRMVGVQSALCGDPKFEKARKQLGIIQDNEIWKCTGRLENSDLSVEAKYPIFLPKSHEFTELVVLDCHRRVTHDGVRSTLVEGNTFATNRRPKHYPSLELEEQHRSSELELTLLVLYL